jgi:hypothetical protein
MNELREEEKKKLREEESNPKREDENMKPQNLSQ